MVSPLNVFSTDWLKKNAKSIHWFGLGFIQIKLNESERVHFYTSALPKTSTEEEIHNHRYNFTSHVLRGSLKQKIYEVDIFDSFTTENTHWLTEETCKETEKKTFPTHPCNIKCVLDTEHGWGSSYYIHHETFHQVDSSNAITLIRRSPYKKETAQIVFPVGSKPLCPFSVKRSESELWDIVRNLL